MWRNVLAVVVGYAAIGILVALTDALSAAVIPGFSMVKEPPLYYFFISLCTDTVFAVAGGYICAWIARSGSRSASFWLIGFGEIMGLASLIIFWDTVPHWYGFALMLVFPLAVWCGYLWRARSSGVETAPAQTTIQQGE